MMEKLTFLTDENIDREVVDFLRAKGFDVFDVKEQGLFGWSDRKILQLAWDQKRIVVSQDSDFGTLIFRDNADFRGVIYLRTGHESSEVHVATMEAILSTDLDLSPNFILVGENQSGTVKIRLRYL